MCIMINFSVVYAEELVDNKKPRKGKSDKMAKFEDQMCMSELGMAFLKEIEGLRLKSYQDEAGVWTVGYGHISGVTKATKISKRQAEDFLWNDLMIAESAVNDFVELELEQYEFKFNKIINSRFSNH